MKNLRFLILILTITLNCSDPDKNLLDEELVENNKNSNEEDENDDSENNSIAYENISNFSISITTPNKERDFTFHNEGKTGVFTQPELAVDFEGEINLDLTDKEKTIDLTDLKITWSSSHDGVLFQGVPTNEYKSTFAKPISKNVHKIFFEVAIGDNPEFIKRDSIVISNVINLEVEPTDKSIKLEWSKYEGSNFQSYLIYRENHEPIVEIHDINVLKHEDFSAELADSKEYQVIVKTSENLDTIYGSNIKEGEAGNYINIPYFVTKIIKDKSRNRIYAIVGDDYSEDYGLIILNNESEKVEINSHILKEHRFSDLDISLDGKYLFLCQKRVDKITRLNLDTQEIFRFNVAYGGWGVHKIEVGNNYRIYCHRRPPTSGSSPFYILDGITGDLKGTFGGFTHGDIEFNTHTDRLYHSSSITSYKRLVKFSIENDVINREAEFNPDIRSTKPFLLLSESGNHIFWETYEFDKELNLIREFENNIVACSSQNDYISDGIKILDYNSLTTILKYPRFPSRVEKSNEIFMEDNSVIISKSHQPYTNSKFTYIFKINIL